MGGAGIGVMTTAYTKWDKAMDQSDVAWYYEFDGTIYHAGKVKESGLAPLEVGSKVTVTLDKGKVTFKVIAVRHTSGGFLGSINPWGKQTESTVTQKFDITLPEDCGKVSLGVTLRGGQDILGGGDSAKV